MSAPFVAAARSGASTCDRLRPTEDEAAALAEIGSFLGGLYRADFARRAAEGRLDAEGRAASRRERKRALTAGSSSRWAGAITRKTEDQYTLGLRGLYDHRMSLRQAAGTIENRLAIKPGEALRDRRGRRVAGYRDRTERFAKSRRLNGLRHRLAKLDARIEAARPSVVHGSRRLLRNRNNLAQAGLTGDGWREQWDAARWFLSADGETGKRCGNETIRATPEGQVTIKVPAALAGKYGTHITLANPLNLGTHRAAEWLDRISTSKAIGYTIAYDPGRHRWYLHAAWTYPIAEQPSLTVLKQQPTLGVDLNDQFLAAWVIDPSGNPTGPHHTIDVRTEGLPAPARDGHLRHAITRLIHLARAHDCGSITIENLNFDTARTTGRETMGRGQRGKRFRRTVAGLPTAQFRQRLIGMTAEAGLSVIAVDPAYTSRWAGENWLPSLHQPATPAKTTGPVTRHHAAAIVIGRRGKRMPARRRPAGLRAHQRTCPDPSAVHPVTAPGIASPAEPGPPPPHPKDTIRTGPEEQERANREPKTVRGPTGQDSLLHSV
jgi:hypothetical protein